MAEPSLLGIPVEIREKILRGCMVIGMAEVRKPGTPTHRFERSKASSEILRVCKQLYSEGAPILYGENILYYSSGTTLPYFLSRTNLATRSMIKHVCVGASHNMNQQSDVLDTLTKLHTFDMFSCSYGWSQDELDRRFAGRPYITRPRDLDLPPRKLIRRLMGRAQSIGIGAIESFSKLRAPGRFDPRPILVCHTSMSTFHLLILYSHLN